MRRMIRRPRVASKSGCCLIPAAFFAKEYVHPLEIWLAAVLRNPLVIRSEQHSQFLLAIFASILKKITAIAASIISTPRATKADAISFSLCDLELADIFDNEVSEYVQLFSVRPQMKNRTRNTGVLFHNSHYFRFRIARFNFKLHFFFLKYVFLAVCSCLSVGVYVFLAAFQVSRCNDLRSGLWENRLERRNCASGEKPLFYFRLLSNR